jgi:hypothetical protein
LDVLSPYLVNGLDDPVDAGITTDGLVLRIDEDDFEVLVGRILVDPVGVEDAKIGGTTTDTLFSSGSERSLVFELVHTLVGGLACLS